MRRRFTERYSSRNSLKKVMAIFISWCYGILVLVFGISVLITFPIMGIAIILFSAISTPMLNLMLLNMM